MKRKALVIFSVFTVALLLSCSRSKDVEEVKPTPEIPTLPGDVEALRYVFDIEALPEIVLEVTTAQWNTLLSNFDTNPQNEAQRPTSLKQKSDRYQPARYSSSL